MNELIIEIQNWARERGIYEKSDVIAQLKITAEEVVEAVEQASLPRCYPRDDYPRDELEIELGDIGVTLINACYLAGFSLEDCLQAAHDKNMQRTNGKMVGGKWVKSE